MAVTSKSITDAYPLDSVVTGLDDDGLPLYDRAYNADTLRGVMRTLVKDGVLGDYMHGLEVTCDGAGAYVDTGGLIADGLQAILRERTKVIDRSDIAANRYAFVIAAARFDSAFRDVEVTAKVTSEQEYEPVRTASRYELVLARVDWRGTVRDLRPDPKMCGIAQPFASVDTGAFTHQLDAALNAFDIKAGKTTTTAPGTEASVTVRKVEGQGALLDVSVPRGDRGEQGPPGRDGRDGSSGVTTPATGFVTFSVDAAGDLYVETPGPDPATAWELDGDGNLYVTTGA